MIINQQNKPFDYERLIRARQDTIKAITELKILFLNLILDDILSSENDSNDKKNTYLFSLNEKFNNNNDAVKLQDLDLLISDLVKDIEANTEMLTQNELENINNLVSKINQSIQAEKNIQRDILKVENTKGLTKSLGSLLIGLSVLAASITLGVLLNQYILISIILSICLIYPLIIASANVIDYTQEIKKINADTDYCLNNEIQIEYTKNNVTKPTETEMRHVTKTLPGTEMRHVKKTPLETNDADPLDRHNLPPKESHQDIYDSSNRTSSYWSYYTTSYDSDTYDTYSSRFFINEDDKSHEKCIEMQQLHFNS